MTTSYSILFEMSFPVNSPPIWNLWSMGNVTGVLIQRSRPICVVIENQIGVFEFLPNRLNENALRFNPVQIAEWLDDLMQPRDSGTQQALSRELGMSRTRVGQFLNLLRLPSGHLSELKAVEGLTEYQLRPIAVMTPKCQARAIHRLLSRSARPVC